MSLWQSVASWSREWEQYKRRFIRRAPAGIPGRKPSFRPAVWPFEDRILLATWQEIGPAPQSNAGIPVTGRVSALAVLDDGMGQQNVILGAAGGGIWRSNSLTQVPAPPVPVRWAPETDFDGLPPDRFTGLGSGLIDIGSIAVDPNEPQTLYAGTGEMHYSPQTRYGSGILRSTDGGIVWDLISSGPASRSNWAGVPAFYRHNVSEIIVDPTSRGPGAPRSSVLYASVMRDPSDPTPLPLRADDAIYKSTDEGKTWARVTDALPDKIGSSILATDLDYTRTAAVPFRIFAGLDNSSGPNLGGIWWSDDGGGKWQQFGSARRPDGTIIGTGAPLGANVGRVALAADHTAGQTVIYAAVANGGSLFNVYRTADNGNTWQTITPTGFGTQAVMPLRGTQKP